LNQFSHVFDLIADYYEDSFLREVQFIKGMSSAMSELSLTMKQCALSQEDEAVHIMELLKGYHYDVLKVYVSHSDTGCLHLVILLNDCLRKDVDDVVLPVLQMNINSNLKLISYRKAQKFSNTVRLEFSSKKPLGIKAKAYRSLDHERTSGDTCAIFQSGNHTICTISDGMGTGVQAEKTSGFVTALTQRLLVCGMPIEMIVRCINSLCSLSQKDQFATLDFLCVDALNHRVILSKNGAAPSYLIRGNETLRIEGHSLPLGIVKQISPDCFQVEVRSKDVFVMCSDGADDVMIQKWLRSRNTAELRQSIEQTLKVHDKKDDITVIVAEIL
ncbi:MAG: SpoIIE family protein phosphatase, partial [Erysipelotrichaceae bacterium]|nr:SpoIIE family protein phosphatase [Erysipelotrichaceae bacterium]